MFREFGVQVTGGQMYLDRARMDFAMEDLSMERIDYIEEKIHEAAEADYSIRVYTLPREQAFAIPDLIRTKRNLLPPEIEEVRIVEVVGPDLQADGGIHVNHTMEVGGIKLRRLRIKAR
jgi:misacylated tRNA(Ala) deacylase